MTSPQNLIGGFHRFREQHFTNDDTLYLQLVQEGQTPKILMVACCDSRVDPALILNCAPGDMFVIRNVANLVPPVESLGGRRHGTSAALEFGVCNLEVEHIIVLGHAQCGGIRALMSGYRTSNADSYISTWIRLAEDAQRQTEQELPDDSPEMRARACEQYAILGSLNNLMTFPWIYERVKRGTLALHGWYFDMENGALLGYNPASYKFETL